jgi:sigma-B regulation protein RsbU (phosphoserine phosphatase)
MPPELPPPVADRVPSARDLLLQSWAGRLFLVAAALKFVLGVIRRIVDVPAAVDVLSSAATIGLAISVGYFVWRLFLLMKRRLLWRVRRKLILSYIFIGVIPAMLILAFFMLGAWVVSTNVSAYLFRDGYDDIENYARLVATAAAAEIARTPASALETVSRVHTNASHASERYRGLAMAFVPVAPAAPPHVRVPAQWSHTRRPPDRVPDWMMKRTDVFSGTIAPTPADGGDVDLVIRAAAPVVTSTGRLGFVVADIPVDGQVLDGLYEATGVKADSIHLAGTQAAPVPPVAGLVGAPRGGGPFSFFEHGVTILDAYDWDSGQVHRATIANTYAIRELYKRLSAAQSAQLGTSGLTFSEGVLLILVVVAVLFLIIQFVALVMGLALARSITSSIHELFMGTERVRHGDFAHRIDIQSNDQLGELAASFNQMTGSIENLLQTAAEKKRLDEELRIARQIQMSLLPRGPLDVPGLAVTALCVPAREVGGDYYDFFPLSDDRLGVLIADVSGKGTSAALYMAELKGLVLSLSQIYQSPRQLLLEVNRIISENLDSRSFITMTYAVLDLSAGSMTYARAGHTPLIHLRHGSDSGRVQVLVPSGMVLGLRIPGAEEKFAELLEEDRLTLAAGDVIVFYTDGITEAMNPESDLFGDARLSRIVEEHGHLESGELRERILREIEAFVGSADQHDDMTMILMKIERLAAPRPVVAAGGAERGAPVAWRAGEQPTH